MSATPENNTQAPKNGTRKRGLTLIAAAVVIAGLAYAGYEWIVGSRYETTDNAYVQANVVQITPLVGGTVRAVYADDTDFVKAGQKLVSLDPVDARVALDQAQASWPRRSARSAPCTPTTAAWKRRSRSARPTCSAA